VKLSRIREAMERIKELPTLPVVARKVNALLYNPDTNASDLAEVVQRDQSITAKILKLVNSAQYNLPERVSNIKQAVTLLGQRNVANIVMTLAVFDTLKSTGQSTFDRREFWIHSISVALMSSRIAGACMYVLTDDVFTAGLLHDIGKVFMDGYLHDEFMQVVEKANAEGISFIEAEHLLFDIDHTLVGEWIARTWKLPLHVIGTVKHHHQEAGERRGLAISSDTFIDYIRLGNEMVKSLGFGHSGDGNGYTAPLKGDLFTRIPIDREETLGLTEGLKEELDRSRTLLGFAL